MLGADKVRRHVMVGGRRSILHMLKVPECPTNFVDVNVVPCMVPTQKVCATSTADLSRLDQVPANDLHLPTHSGNANP